MHKILVVDDVKEVRKSVMRTLNKKKYTLYEAANGVEAVEMLNKVDVDLMILDILMPYKGGIDTLLDVKNIREVKTIIITGISLPDSDAFENLVKQFGAKKILHKPFKKQELLDAVSEALII